MTIKKSQHDTSEIGRFLKLPHVYIVGDESGGIKLMICICTFNSKSVERYNVDRRLRLVAKRNRRSKWKGRALVALLLNLLEPLVLVALNRGLGL